MQNQIEVERNFQMCWLQLNSIKKLNFVQNKIYSQRRQMNSLLWKWHGMVGGETERDRKRELLSIWMYDNKWIRDRIIASKQILNDRRMKSQWQQHKSDKQRSKKSRHCILWCARILNRLQMESYSVSKYLRNAHKHTHWRTHSSITSINEKQLLAYTFTLTPILTRAHNKQTERIKKNQLSSISRNTIWYLPHK